MNVHIVTAESEQTGNRVHLIAYDNARKAYDEQDRINDQVGGGWTNARVRHMKVH